MPHSLSENYCQKLNKINVNWQKIMLFQHGFESPETEGFLIEPLIASEVSGGRISYIVNLNSRSFLRNIARKYQLFATLGDIEKY